MTFCIISHVLHKRDVNDALGGYAPYVREMNLWLKHVDKVIVVAPCEHKEFTPIDIPYQHADIRLYRVPAVDFTTAKGALRSIISLPYILGCILLAMAMSDHVHLRCPGNMGLLGAFCQIFFPWKKKTAKYAGNWDWNSHQPATYRMQQRLLRSRIFTHRMQALVYGEWPDKNKNILPFFTATYHESELTAIPQKDLKGRIILLFVGTLSSGKRPMLSVETVKLLLEKGVDVELHLLGEGPERNGIEEYIATHKLENNVFLHGNVDKATVEDYCKKSHFLLFASKSEGWPKAVAEAMCWECLPITTAVSCVPKMLGEGERGKIVSADVNSIAEAVLYYLKNETEYNRQKHNASTWSRQYTIEKFESEIEKLI